jgi:hypothetical protein
VTAAQLHDEALSLYKSGAAKNINDAAEILIRNHLDFGDLVALAGLGAAGPFRGLWAICVWLSNLKKALSTLTDISAPRPIAGAIPGKSLVHTKFKRGNALRY